MSSAATAIVARNTPLFSRQLLWVSGCFVLAVLPQADDFRPWLLVLAGITVGWRLLIEWMQWRLPNKWLRTGLAFAAMLGVFGAYRTLNGLEAGTAFLVVMGAMKLLETRTKRDLTIVLFVSYFLVFAGFLYEQQLLMLPYMLLTVWILTATLMRVHGSAATLNKEALLTTGKMLALSLPLATLLFLFFPRLPGQFWAIPGRETARSGLNEEVSPGDVSELAISGTTAFRARFEPGVLPPSRERYWRGPVLMDFDGRTWRRSRAPFVERALTAQAPVIRYRLVLQPHDRFWVFALDAPTAWPRGTRRTPEYQIVSNRRISTMMSYDIESSTAYRTEGPLPKVLREAALRLPPNRNPRTLALAKEMRAAVNSDAEFVTAVLQKFRQEAFYYTYRPPQLLTNPVDEFLFETRQGFCEHFASAFTALARAAGIPARLVTGYQGGEFNPLSGYLVVRQSDAHAWSEVWLEDRGWVRVDPTAAIAPERVERGIEAAISDEESVPGRVFARSTLLSQLRNAWDAVNTYWNDNIVEFGRDDQESLLAYLGIEDPDWEALGIALAASLVGFFALLSAYLALRYRRLPRDPLVEIYEGLCRRLAKRDLARAPHEGPDDYLRRVERARPELAGTLREIRQIYIALRYGPAPLGSQLSRLKFLVNQLKV